MHKKGRGDKILPAFFISGKGRSAQGRLAIATPTAEVAMPTS